MESPLFNQVDGPNNSREQRLFVKVVLVACALFLFAIGAALGGAAFVGWRHGHADPTLLLLLFLLALPFFIGGGALVVTALRKPIADDGRRFKGKAGIRRMNAMLLFWLVGAATFAAGLALGDGEGQTTLILVAGMVFCGMVSVVIARRTWAEGRALDAERR